MSSIRPVNVVTGGMVALITAPTGIGAVAGGWIAARQASSARSGAVAGGPVGTLGAGPWAALVYAASAGVIGRIGYHTDVVHVGLEPVAPGAIVPWQAVGLAAFVGLCIVAFAAFGGLVAGHSTNVPTDVRPDRVRTS